jgi:SAM-dependent methyltransferase
MVNAPRYSKEFFEAQRPGAALSALAIVPIVVELIRPTSVVDVGCGTGEFLRVFQEHGVREILGIDGTYVESSLLAIPQEHFRAVDIQMPFTLGRTYDLALCLEVAEHVAPESASDLIASLTRLAPVILFSAAIPFQGGTHHVNEQWPEYWAHLFQERGYLPVDALRRRIWSNRQIEVWYRQNALLFCTEQALASNHMLEREFRATDPGFLSIVHPEFYLLNHWALNYSVRFRIALRHVKSMTRKILP